MAGRLQFDEEISRKVEALYLTPDVVAQRGRVLNEFAELGTQGKFFFSLNRYLFVADKLAT
jgi:hypothetical protein